MTDSLEDFTAAVFAIVLLHSATSACYGCWTGINDALISLNVCLVIAQQQVLRNLTSLRTAFF